MSPEPGSALGNYSMVLAGVQIAAPLRRRLASGLDLIPALMLVGVAVAVVARSPEGDRADLFALVVVTLLVYIAAHVSWFTTRGRSLGRSLLHLRTVDDLTGEPAGALAAFLPTSRTLTADLRRGRDPLVSGALPATLAPVDSGDGLEADLPPSRRPVEVEQSPSVALILDSGERLEVQTSLLIGRSPSVSDGEEHPMFAWPDLSRSISKTHALFEWSGSVLWVTDLASTNGTTLVSPSGERQPLVSGLRGAAAPGWTVQVGERVVEVHPSGVVSP